MLPHNSCTAGEIGWVRSPAWNSERKIGSVDAVCVRACELPRPASRRANPESSRDRPRCRSPAPPAHGAGERDRVSECRRRRPPSRCACHWRIGGAGIARVQHRIDLRDAARVARFDRRRSSGWPPPRSETSARRMAFGLSSAFWISFAAPPTPMKCAI